MLSETSDAPEEDEVRVGRRRRGGGSRRSRGLSIDSTVVTLITLVLRMSQVGTTFDSSPSTSEP